MNIKEAKNEIKNTVKAYLDKNEFGQYKIPEIRQRPILLMGPPGIGKTQIMEQIARECSIGLIAYTITHHTRQSAVGLPYIKEKEYEGHTFSVTEYTMSEIIASIYQYKEDTGLKEGILFIDEINCVSETLAPTMLQFLQCKTFGNQAVPPGWIIVACGNPPEYNRSVHEFDFVTLDRVRRIHVEADLDVFLEYARSRRLHPFILSYLKLRPGNFYKTEQDVDGLHFVTARGWEDMSFLIKSYEDLAIEVNENVIGQFLQHEEVAKDVAVYYDLYQKYRDDYDINRILAGQADSATYQRLFHASFDERLSFVELLSSGLLARISPALKKEDLAAAAYDVLQEYLLRIKQNDPDFYDDHIYERLLEEKRAAFPADKARMPGNPQAVFFHHELLSLLESWAPKGAASSREAFLSVKEKFDHYNKDNSQLVTVAQNALEDSFTFMEEAFGQGQEMVVFVTDLTMDPDASRFIAENGCEPYFRYHKSLLIGSRRASILNELERKEIYSSALEWEF